MYSMYVCIMLGWRERRGVYMPTPPCGQTAWLMCMRGPPHLSRARTRAPPGADTTLRTTSTCSLAMRVANLTCKWQGHTTLLYQQECSSQCMNFTAGARCGRQDDCSQQATILKSQAAHSNQCSCITWQCSRSPQAAPDAPRHWPQV
jgi:hypothetical protein